jgi:putative peptidoglycan lipid II flippase
VNRAFLVAAGILTSRLTGFVRLRAFAHYFGQESNAADAFNAGFRICNFLNNLLGEGAFSASFIPVYASLVARRDHRAADRLAGAIGALLGLLVAVLVLLGVFAAPVLTSLLAPGFSGEKRILTIAVIRVLFPGAGLLVLSAWCLGVLNSHHRFLLSYSAPALWNAAMISTLLAFGATTDPPRLAVVLAWGSVVGAALQVAVQLIAVRRVAPDVRMHLSAASDHVRSVLRNFLPAVMSRGVVQISAFVDVMIATLLPTGAVTGLANAQLIHSLPVSLFGISVAAAELPAMAGEASPDQAGADAIRTRLDAGLKRVAFFVIPSAVAFLALGDVVAAAILQTGRFVAADSQYVWGILAGSGVGLLASTLGRLYSSAFYAFRDTTRPLRYAVIRVSLTLALGLLFALRVPAWIGIAPRWGAAGLTASAGLAAWVEMLLLRATLNRRIGRTGLPADYTIRLWGAAISAAAMGWGIKLLLPPLHPMVTALPVLGGYGVVYVLLTVALGIPEASHVIARLRSRRSRSAAGA